MHRNNLKTTLPEKNESKEPFLYPLKNALFRFRICVLTRASTLRLCMIFLLYCTVISFFLMGFLLLRDKQTLQKGISDHVVRLHVIANSDSKKDQTLKLKVRDEIIEHLQDSLKNAHSEAEAEKVIKTQLSSIRKTAINTLRCQGCSDSVTAVLTDRAFPQKTYGDLTFPAGTYRALCVEIGKASGHNWWCVLFPSLCFVNETTATVPDKSKQKLKKSLTKEEYDLLEKKPEPRSLFLDKILGTD